MITKILIKNKNINKKLIKFKDINNNEFDHIIISPGIDIKKCKLSKLPKAKILIKINHRS